MATGGEQNLRMELLWDVSQPNEVLDRLEARVKRMEALYGQSAQSQAQSAAQAAAKVDKEQERVARNAERWIAREYKDRMEYAKKQEALAEQRRKAEEREAERTAKDAERWVAREYKQRMEYARKQEALAEQKRKAEEREQERIARNAERWLAREYRERVEMARREEALARRRQEQFENQHSIQSKVKDGLREIAAEFVAAVGAGALMAGVAEIMDRIYNRTSLAVDFTRAFKQELQELAALKGRLGQTGTETVEQMRFRQQTLQSAEQAREFQESALGVGQAGMDVVDPLTGKVKSQRFISPKEFQKTLVGIGSVQAVEGGAAEVYGQMAGQIPLMLGRRTNAEEVMDITSQLYAIQQPGGSKFSSGIRQFVENAGMVDLFGGDRKGIMKMMALQSAFSVAAPEKAGTKVEQFLRATVGSQGKMRGTSMEGDDVQKIGEYLATLTKGQNITDPIEIGKLIATDVAAQMKPGLNDKDQEQNLLNYLATKGYGNINDALTMLDFTKMHRTGMFKGFEELTDPASAPGARQAFMGPVQAWQAGDQEAIARKADISEEMGNLKLGMGGAGLFKQLARIEYERRSKMNDSWWWNFQGDFETTMGSWMPWDIQTQRLTKMGVLTNLRDEGVRAIQARGGGREELEKFQSKWSDNTLNMHMNLDNPQALGEATMALASDVAAAGGQVTPNWQAQMDMSAKQLEAQNQANEYLKTLAGQNAGAGNGNAGRPAPPPLPPAPVVPGGARP